MKRKIRKITLIIFSYNRANQLNFLLNSIKKNFKYVDYPIHIILRTSKKHKKSYKILKKIWKNKIVFHERIKKNKFSLIKEIIMWPLNLLWILRWPSIFKEWNNFKEILLKVIKKSSNKNIMFSTDDQFVYKKTLISEKIFNILEKNDENTSYRFNTSDKFKDENKINKKMKIYYFDKYKKCEYFKWYNNDSYADKVWRYRFHVDASIFPKSSLLNFLKFFVFNNPITLEGIGLWESRIRNYFNIGYSSKIRSNIGVQANNLQKLIDTPTNYFDVELLRKAFEDKFQFYIKRKDIKEDQHIFIPKNIYFKKGNKKISYEKLYKTYN